MTTPTCEPSWLAAQRWYGAAHRTIRSLEVVASEPLPGGGGRHWQVVEVTFTEGDGADRSVFYQLFWDVERGTEVADPAPGMRWLFPELAVAEARILSGEQSNTSVVVEPGPAIVKVLRRLSAEPNPDSEVVRQLWESGFRGVPEPLAERRRRIDVESLRGGPVDLAVARRFLPGSTDGWDLALGASGGFEEASSRLGTLTAQLHLALAHALGRHDFDAGAAATQMADHARRVMGDDAPTHAFARLARGGVEPAIRVHGDYHLGQVLLHDDTWFVLDFEGEPARPVAERTAPAPPLRDVAGMLRSFAYAAVVAGHPAGWEEACRAAFLDAYLDTPGIGDLLPREPGPVLDAFELDKAIYEIAYERANRPDWVAIPRAAVERLTRGIGSARP